MSYTPTTWVTGDTVTATKLNKIEQGIADSGGGGGSAFIKFSALHGSSATTTFGYLVYALYDDNNERWQVANDNDAAWNGFTAAGSSPPRLIPPEYTILPSDEDIGLFFILSAGTIAVTGDISSNATTLYFSWGATLSHGYAYRITGDGSITITYD